MWIEMHNAKEKRKLWNTIINDIIIEIEDQTHCSGLFKKITHETELLIH